RKEVNLSELKIFTDEDGEMRFEKGGRFLTGEKLDSHQARRVKECALICTELDDALFWLMEMRELIKDSPEEIVEKTEQAEREARIARAYFTSACITYFKFFTHGHGMSVKLDASKLYDASQLALHNDIEELRHKLMAHIDRSDEFTHDLYSIVDPKG
ncbi:TPA: hypothetical protein ACPJZT_003302, partial [Vibrio alginolyticus]